MVANGAFFGSSCTQFQSMKYENIYSTPSQKTSHLWLAITLTHMNGFWHFFDKNVTDKVGNKKMLYCVTSNNLCFCTTWQNGKTWISHFYSLSAVSRERCSSWTMLHTKCTSVLSSWKKTRRPASADRTAASIRWQDSTCRQFQAKLRGNVGL